MPRWIRSFLRFWFDFVVGDDWRIAAGVVGLGACGAWLVHDDVVRTSIVAVGVGAAVVVLVVASIVLDAARTRSS